jgi:Adenoviral fibre protein (repeat/shaft region)
MSIDVNGVGGSTVSLNTHGSDTVININEVGGDTMASRSGPVTININVDVDDTNQLFGLLGDGLIAVTEEVPIDHKQIDVYLGQGLEFGPEETGGGKRVMVQAGAGLGFDASNNLVAQIGPGLVINAQNQITTDGSQAQIIGEGLIIDATTGLIDVNCGKGLDINPNNTVEVNVGAGLEIATNNSVAINIGEGFAIGDQNQLELNIGTGLTFDETGALIATGLLPGIGPGLTIASNGDLEVNLGNGLNIDANGRLNVDNTAPGIPQTFRVLTDTQFSFQDSVLYISKVFTTYTVGTSSTGSVVSISATSTSVENDTVTFSNGYGLPFGPAIPNRTKDPAKPSFYKV